MDKQNAKQKLEDQLFPYLPISHGALEKAQTYVNTTIEEHGIVESYVYGLCDLKDPEHIIRDVYFPNQLCSRDGVKVEASDVEAAGEAMLKTGLFPNGWSHHHAYGPLKPSGPYQPEINDKQNNRSLLNALGHTLYLKCYKPFYQGKDGIILHANIEGKTETITSDSLGLKIVLGDQLYSAREADLLMKAIQSAQFSIPVNFSYVYSLILNPTIEPTKTMERFSLKWGPSSFFGDNSFDPNAKFQKDIYKDPYAEVAWRMWSPIMDLPENYSDKQLPLKIIELEHDVVVDKDAIRKEVLERAKVGKVQSSSYYPDDEHEKFWQTTKREGVNIRELLGDLKEGFIEIFKGGPDDH